MGWMSLSAAELQAGYGWTEAEIAAGSSVRPE